MRDHESALAILLGLGVMGCATPQPSASSATPARPAAAAVVWPVRDGWRPETIPFPLDFAPEIPLQGVEELRFAPGFMDPAAPSFFSYAFAWSLEGAPDLSRPVMERTLVTYFHGLCTAVTSDAELCSVEHHHAQLDERSVGDVRRYAGSVDIIEPFKTRKPLALHVTAAISRCPSGRWLVSMLLSPRPEGDPVWTELSAQLATLRCAP